MENTQKGLAAPSEFDLWCGQRSPLLCWTAFGGPILLLHCPQHTPLSSGDVQFCVLLSKMHGFYLSKYINT